MQLTTLLQVSIRFASKLPVWHKGYASTKVAARGMIITTYDILKQEVQHTDLFHTVTGWHIAKEGQPQPPVRLVSRYDNAERILLESGSTISGRRLLKPSISLQKQKLPHPYQTS